MRSPVAVADRSLARRTRSFVAFLSLLTLLFAACGDNVKPSSPDASITDAADIDGPPTDAATDAPTDAMVDASPDAMVDASTVGQIEAARATADGTGLMLPIEGVYVTYLKPAIGTDPAGFTIQASMDGPALFIAVDPASLTPAPTVGDQVSFTITEMGTQGMLRRAMAISDFTRLSQGFNVDSLVQNVSNAADLVTAVTDYESELVDAMGTLAGNFFGAGSMFQEIQIQTPGLPNDPNLRVRMPIALRDANDIVAGCSMTINNTPVGRFDARVQLAIFSTADFTLSGCPAPTVVSAIATSSTEVVVTFSRNIDPTSVLANGSQFTFDNGLTASAATTDGRTVTVTTSAQSNIMTYTVTVANTVEDLQGTALGMPNSATFPGFVVPAVVRINEFNARVTNGCDLIELRVVQGGTLLGMRLTERTGGSGELNFTFPAVVVGTNALIVVHTASTNATCNPGNATAETTAPDQQPRANFAANFDTAYDFYDADTGLTDTDNVFTLFTATGTIMDAVLADDDTPPAMPGQSNVAAGSETAAAAAAAANQWFNNDGTQPAGGYIDDDFRFNAALDLNATTTSGQLVTSTSIQRLDNTDDNNKADWNTAVITTQLQTFGALNLGQVLF